MSTTPKQSDAVLSRDDRCALATMMVQLFDHWGLDQQAQLSLLGLPEASRAELQRYRDGAPLSASSELLDRVYLLLFIHKHLRLLYPHNRDLAYTWMSKRNRAFDNRTPIDWVTEHGLDGLVLVREYLDDIVEPGFRETGLSKTGRY